MRVNYDTSRDEESARRLRGQISSLFGAPRPSDIVLAPGGLIALRILFNCLGVKRLLLTEDEYYEPLHFSGLDVVVCKSDALVQTAKRVRPDVAIASVVSWKGKYLNVPEYFSAICRFNRPPLLVADYAHAGACGFPRIRSLHADLVFGDIAKWVTPPGFNANVTYLWGGSRTVKAVIREAFQGFYLATSHNSSKAATWVRPEDIQAILGFLVEKQLTRRDLLRQFSRNIAVARTLAEDLRLRNVPDTGIVWTSGSRKRAKRKFARLEQQGLVWKIADGYRVLCRAEVL